MKTAKITPLTILQYAEIFEDVLVENNQVFQSGMLDAKCVTHPEYGDIILISSTHCDCFMIHF